MSYVENLVYDKIHDCYVLPLPDTLLQELGWELGDTLVWCIENDLICLRKYEDVTARDIALNAMKTKITKGTDNG